MKHVIRKTTMRVIVILAIFLFGFGATILSSFQTKPTVYKIPSITHEAANSTTSQDSALEQATISRVIDGDTVELSDGRHVRYIGMDTPETVDPRKPIECFGRQASEENKGLVEGRTVRLEKDVSETDKYGRLLRYVYIGDVMVNDYLVRQGFAHVSTFPPDVKFTSEFVAAEKEARENNRGLWNGCP